MGPNWDEGHSHPPASPSYLVGLHTFTTTPGEPTDLREHLVHLMHRVLQENFSILTRSHRKFL